MTTKSLSEKNVIGNNFDVCAVDKQEEKVLNNCPASVSFDNFLQHDEGRVDVFNLIRSLESERQRCNHVADKAASTSRENSVEKECSKLATLLQPVGLKGEEKALHHLDTPVGRGDTGTDILPSSDMKEVSRKKIQSRKSMKTAGVKTNSSSTIPLRASADVSSGRRTGPNVLFSGGPTENNRQRRYFEKHSSHYEPGIPKMVSFHKKIPPKSSAIVASVCTNTVSDPCRSNKVYDRLYNVSKRKQNEGRRRRIAISEKALY